ncbi:MAG: 30S ribosomal protein S1 [Nitrospirae bacterium CG_4_9_14_0_8_um_filter_70_14]|nr:MAG: 30S ribosomal protein S1 [Nitrospirae bacterium CG_4_9_14_0_8_um_filter_70_14]
MMVGGWGAGGGQRPARMVTVLSPHHPRRLAGPTFPPSRIPNPPIPNPAAAGRQGGGCTTGGHAWGGSPATTKGATQRDSPTASTHRLRAVSAHGAPAFMDRKRPILINRRASHHLGRRPLLLTPSRAARAVHPRPPRAKGQRMNQQDSQPSTPETDRRATTPVAVATIPTLEFPDVPDEQLTTEQMEQLYAQTFQNAAQGSLIQGTIISVGKDEVIVDVGFKSEGVLLMKEFRRSNSADIQVGDAVDLYLEEVEDDNGQVVLSKEKADKIKIWNKVAEFFEKGEALEGTLVSRIKGGLSVDLGGIRGFLPGSQVDIRPVRNLDRVLGQTLEMKVIKMNQARGNIVLSRRQLLEEQRTGMKEKILSNIQEGQIVKGVVKNLTDYGAFVDLGGIDGLLHITDISWGRIGHPSEVFTIGDAVEVVILKFDRERERVSLGYKQKTPDPWVAVEQKYRVNDRVSGKVVSITDYGAFIELEEGIEGLVHVSEMSWTQRVKHPSKVVNLGDVVDAMVLNIDAANKRISLGIKQVEANPWDSIEERYPVGSRISGTVRNITDFGVFIGLEEGIDGLVHISDLSWTEHVKHPSELLSKGDEVEAVVIAIDKEKERISLGIKQIQEDPWQQVAGNISIGSVVDGTVTKITEFGAFVDLGNDVDSLIHISEISTEQIRSVSDVLKVGDKVHAQVIKFDPAQHKIGLSMRALQNQEEREQVERYMEHETMPETAMGAALLEKLRAQQEEGE